MADQKIDLVEQNQHSIQEIEYMQQKLQYLVLYYLYTQVLAQVAPDS